MLLVLRRSLAGTITGSYRSDLFISAPATPNSEEGQEEQRANCPSLLISRAMDVAQTLRYAHPKSIPAGRELAIVSCRSTHSHAKASAWVYISIDF